MDEERTYGVEIEISGTRQLGTDLGGIASALLRAGIPAVSARYGSDDQPERGNWKVLPDASCGPEFVSPPLRGERGLAGDRPRLPGARRTRCGSIRSLRTPCAP